MNEIIFKPKSIYVGDVLSVMFHGPELWLAPLECPACSLSKVPSPNSTLTFRSPFSDLPERGIFRFQSRDPGIPLLCEQTWLHVSPVSVSELWSLLGIDRNVARWVTA
jgi:hypothetical protein